MARMLGGKAYMSGGPPSNAAARFLRARRYPRPRTDDARKTTPAREMSEGRLAIAIRPPGMAIWPGLVRGFAVVRCRRRRVASPRARDGVASSSRAGGRIRGMKCRGEARRGFALRQAGGRATDPSVGAVTPRCGREVPSPSHDIPRRRGEGAPALATSGRLAGVLPNRHRACRSRARSPRRADRRG